MNDIEWNEFRKREYELIVFYKDIENNILFCCLLGYIHNYLISSDECTLVRYLIFGMIKSVDLSQMNMKGNKFVCGLTSDVLLYLILMSYVN